MLPPFIYFILFSSLLATPLKPRGSQPSRIKIYTAGSAAQRSRSSMSQQLKENIDKNVLEKAELVGQNFKNDASFPVAKAQFNEQGVKGKSLDDNEQRAAQASETGRNGNQMVGDENPAAINAAVRDDAVATPTKISLRMRLRKDLGSWRRFHRVTYLYRDRPRRVPYHPNFIHWLRSFEIGYMRLKQIGIDLHRIDSKLSRMRDTELAHADEEEDASITVPDAPFCRRPCLLCQREKVMNRLVKLRSWILETFEKFLLDFQRYYEQQLKYGMKLQQKEREPMRIALYKSMESSLLERYRFVSDLLQPTIFSDDDSSHPDQFDHVS